MFIIKNKKIFINISKRALVVFALFLYYPAFVGASNLYQEITPDKIQYIYQEPMDNAPREIPKNFIYFTQPAEPASSNVPREIPKENIYFEKERSNMVADDNTPREVPKENIFYKPGFAPLGDNIPREVPKELINDITDREREEVKKAIEESIQYTKSKKATNTTNTKKIAPMQKVDSQESPKLEITSQKPTWFQRLFKLFSK